MRRWRRRHAQGTTFGVAKTAENDMSSVVPGRASFQVASSLLPSTRAAAQRRVKCLLSGCLFPGAEIGPMFLVAPLLKSNSTGLEMAPDSGPRYGPETRAGFYGFPENTTSQLRSLPGHGFHEEPTMWHWEGPTH